MFAKFRFSSILRVDVTANKSFPIGKISIGNSMICSDISHKYHEWYFKIVKRN